MSIVRLSKVTLYGAAEEKAAVLDSLQNLGCVHLLSLRAHERQRPGAGVSGEVHEALKYLESCPVQRRPVREDASFDLKRVAAEALHLRQRTQELRDEREQLVREIERQKPWGEFRLPPAEALGGQRLWFYIVPHYRMRVVRTLDLTWQSVARDHRFDYVAVIRPDEPQGMPVPRVDLDPRSLTELTDRLDHVEDELEELHWRRVVLTRWRRLLTRTLAAADDRDRREEAARQTWDDDRVFALQGWAPESALPRLREFAERQVLALTAEEPQADELPPTLLKNPELLAGGEEAVKFYMTPGYRTWDPSLAVFFAFSLFFAMILADAGYALLLGAAVFFLWNKLGASASGVRVRRLGVALAVVSFLYGVAAGAWFGMAPPEGTLLASLHVLDSRDRSVMMPFAILIGTLHVGFAIGVTGWQVRRSPQVLASIGWMAMLAGGLAAGFAWTETAPEHLLERLFSAGVGLVAAGAGLVLLFSSPRPLWPRTWTDPFGRMFDGVKSLTSVSQAFGDVLSYLRLFALGLASTQLAVTFNDLAVRAGEHPGLGVLLGTLVFLVGHGFNFILATLSGVVHGLRLNCIEFFKWGLPEEGYPFRPFARKSE